MDKISTGIPGFDVLLGGGIPKGSFVLVGGPPGVGKTILVTQMAFHHASQGKKVVMLTALTETNAKLIAHLSTLAFFDDALLGNTLQILNIQKLLQEEGLDKTLAEIRSTVIEQGVELLVIDSFRSLFTLTGDAAAVQNFIFNLSSALFMLGCTTLMVEDQYRMDGFIHPEQAISDTIIHLSLSSLNSSATRKIEVLKMRGGDPIPGKHYFEITPSGIAIYPRIESLASKVWPCDTNKRVSWGVAGLDEITGGVPVCSSNLVLGPLGVGKSLLSLQFLAAGIREGQRVLFATFYDTLEDLSRRLFSVGVDLEDALNKGNVIAIQFPFSDISADKLVHQIISQLPESSSSRLVIDGFEVVREELDRDGRFMPFVGALAQIMRSRNVTTLITCGDKSMSLWAASPEWAPMDNILTMDRINLSGELRRVLTIVKMRGIEHDNTVYEFTITPTGIEIKDTVEEIGR